MILRALCLMLLFGAVQAAAHSLPGAMIVVQIKDSTLDLTVQVAREDLVIAAPELSGLEDLSPEEPVPAPLRATLTAYFGTHIHVTQNGKPLPLELRGVTLVPHHHDQVGDFVLVKIHWQVVAQESGDLLFRYDAVMHEVRNHRATVIWRTADGDAILGHLRFHGPSNGIRLPAAKVGHD